MVVVRVQIAFAQLSAVVHELFKHFRTRAADVFNGRGFVAPKAIEGKVACHHDEPATQMQIIREILFGLEKLDECLLHDIFGERRGIEDRACSAIDGVLVLIHGSFYKLTALQ